MTFYSLDILYMVLAIILLPIGTLICMILYRVYCMMDRVERITAFVDRLVNYASDLEKVPAKILERFLSK